MKSLKELGWMPDSDVPDLMAALDAAAADADGLPGDPSPVPLGQLIDRLSRPLPPRISVPEHQQRQLVGLLRELRARRIAMGRDPDDERNGPADLCCCGDECVPFDSGLPAVPMACPIHPRGNP